MGVRYIVAVIASPALVTEALTEPFRYPDALAVKEYVLICRLLNRTAPEELVVPEVPAPDTVAPEIKAFVT